MKQGFTLMELLLCLAVMSILLAAMAGPVWADQMDRWRLHAAAWQLANDLRWARTLAIEERRAYSVRARQSGYYIRAEQSPEWETKQYKLWPEGVGLHPSYKRDVTFTFTHRGRFGATDNDTVNLLSRRGKHIKVVISGGGRIQIKAGISGR